MYRNTAWLIATIQGSTNLVVDYCIYSEATPTTRWSLEDPHYQAIVLTGIGKDFAEGTANIYKQLTSSVFYRHILTHPSMQKADATGEEVVCVGKDA